MAAAPADVLVESLLVGVVDTHVHSGPSRVPRLLDHIDMIQQASAAGYRAIVTKDHYYDGAPLAALVNAHYGRQQGDGSCEMLSGVTLNDAVGGVNPRAVEASAAIGGRAVWLPTFASRNHIRWLHSGPSYQHPGSASNAEEVRPVDVLTPNGEVVDDLKHILDFMAGSGQVLIGGHLHADEIKIVFAEAIRRGVTRLLVLHPEEIVDGSYDDVRELVALGAYIEHSMNVFLPDSRFKEHEPEVLHEYIEAGGVDHTILASDLGQSDNPNPIDGMRDAIRMALGWGYSEDDVRALTSRNGAALFGLSL